MTGVMGVVRSRLHARWVLAALIAVPLVVVAGGVWVTVNADASPDAALMGQALKGLQISATPETATDPALLSRYFVGKALLEKADELDHYRQLVQEKTDLPGALTFTHVQLLDGYSQGESRVIDVSVHEDLANMRDGAVTDHSADDALYHFIFIKAGGTWKVTDYTWQFAPGSGP